jgi:hypothetical protein
MSITVKFACNIRAMSKFERPRYQQLTKQLLAAVRERQEMPDGYKVRIDGSTLSLPEAAEWMSFERLCCPFLTLQLEASGKEQDWFLSLKGPAGVKAVLDAELPLERSEG